MASQHDRFPSTAITRIYTPAAFSLMMDTRMLETGSYKEKKKDHQNKQLVVFPWTHNITTAYMLPSRTTQGYDGSNFSNTQNRWMTCPERSTNIDCRVSTKKKQKLSMETGVHQYKNISAKLGLKNILMAISFLFSGNALAEQFDHEKLLKLVRQKKTLSHSSDGAIKPENVKQTAVVAQLQQHSFQNKVSNSDDLGNIPSHNDVDNLDSSWDDFDLEKHLTSIAAELMMDPEDLKIIFDEILQELQDEDNDDSNDIDNDTENRNSLEIENYSDEIATEEPNNFNSDKINNLVDPGKASTAELELIKSSSDGHYVTLGDVVSDGASLGIALPSPTQDTPKDNHYSPISDLNPHITDDWGSFRQMEEDKKIDSMPIATESFDLCSLPENSQLPHCEKPINNNIGYYVTISIFVSIIWVTGVILALLHVRYMRKLKKERLLEEEEEKNEIGLSSEIYSPESGEKDMLSGVVTNSDQDGFSSVDIWSGLDTGKKTDINGATELRNKNKGFHNFFGFKGKLRSQSNIHRQGNNYRQTANAELLRHGFHTGTGRLGTATAASSRMNINLSPDAKVRKPSSLLVSMLLNGGPMSDDRGILVDQTAETDPENYYTGVMGTGKEYVFSRKKGSRAATIRKTNSLFNRHPQRHASFSSTPSLRTSSLISYDELEGGAIGMVRSKTHGGRTAATTPILKIGVKSGTETIREFRYCGCCNKIGSLSRSYSASFHCFCKGHTHGKGRIRGQTGDIRSTNEMKEYASGYKHGSGVGIAVPLINVPTVSVSDNVAKIVGTACGAGAGGLPRDGKLVPSMAASILNRDSAAHISRSTRSTRSKKSSKSLKSTSEHSVRSGKSSKSSKSRESKRLSISLMADDDKNEEIGENNALWKKVIRHILHTPRDDAISRSLEEGHYSFPLSSRPSMSLADDLRSVSTESEFDDGIQGSDSSEESISSSENSDEEVGWGVGLWGGGGGLAGSSAVGTPAPRKKINFLSANPFEKVLPPPPPIYNVGIVSHEEAESFSVIQSFNEEYENSQADLAKPESAAVLDHIYGHGQVSGTSGNMLLPLPLERNFDGHEMNEHFERDLELVSRTSSVSGSLYSLDSGTPSQFVTAFGEPFYLQSIQQPLSGTERRLLRNSQRHQGLPPALPPRPSSWTGISGQLRFSVSGLNRNATFGGVRQAGSALFLPGATTAPARPATYSRAPNTANNVEGSGIDSETNSSIVPTGPLRIGRSVANRGSKELVKNDSDSG